MRKYQSFNIWMRNWKRNVRNLKKCEWLLSCWKVQVFLLLMSSVSHLCWLMGLHFCVWCILFCCVPPLKAVFTGVGGFFLCWETTTSISFEIFDLASVEQDKIHCFDGQLLIVMFIINVCFIFSCLGCMYPAESNIMLVNMIFCNGLLWKGHSLLLEGKCLVRT
jgi:hypothetical protein